MIVCECVGVCFHFPVTLLLPDHVLSQHMDSKGHHVGSLSTLLE